MYWRRGNKWNQCIVPYWPCGVRWWHQPLKVLGSVISWLITIANVRPANEHVASVVTPPWWIHVWLVMQLKSWWWMSLCALKRSLLCWYCRCVQLQLRLYNSAAQLHAKASNPRDGAKRNELMSTTQWSNEPPLFQAFMVNKKRVRMIYFMFSKHPE